jgi:signal transduction histidine kinase
MNHAQESNPIPLENIHDSALLAAEQVRRQSLLIQPAAIRAWKNFLTSTQTPQGDLVANLEQLNTLWGRYIRATNLSSDDTFDSIATMLDNQPNHTSDWIQIGTFLIHDIHHIDPRELLGMLMPLMVLASKDNKVTVLPRHNQFLQTTIEQSSSLASLKALPLEFVAGVIQLEQQKPLPTESFKPLELITQMSSLIRARFFSQDYDIVINGSRDQTERNVIYLNISENLFINTNKSMIFSIIYNLVKNAAKANEDLADYQGENAFENAYEGKPIEHPKSLTVAFQMHDTNLQITISDTAKGLSVDQSLTRMHKELARKIEQQGVTNVRESEWFQTIQRTIGIDQANYLIAWPTNPNALRNITVGSIFDMQFVAGFGPDVWEIRSYTSGMGLWGVRYLTEHLGGSVMGTNKFDGGAQFSIILPKSSVCLT